ncbi:MAG: hypothetical protein IPH08_19015 [Rhodocyclaceae bacterium]|nr:hypothetical protein [Rhodocyclaceae bacterium]MBK6909091.1 hypothetical protein [Rhodocyclaceae bacterium]
MKIIVGIVAVFFIAKQLHAAESFTTYVLETENHTVEITPHCAEGFVTCEQVSYKSVNKKTGTALALRDGVTVSTTCADGVTPCRFVGYSFRNGKRVYFVGEDLDGEGGTLSISKGNKVLLQERGLWK